MVLKKLQQYLDLSVGAEFLNQRSHQFSLFLLADKRLDLITHLCKRRQLGGNRGLLLVDGVDFLLTDNYRIKINCLLKVRTTSASDATAPDACAAWRINALDTSVSMAWA